MKAIDTSIVVRYLTGDDPRQAPRARAVVDAGDIFVSITVLLEAEWVLCSVYGFSGQDVAAALRAFSGLPGVFVENPALLAVALDHAAAGMDFADALHLGAATSAATHCETMFTFDRRFIEQANDPSVKVMEP
ncbi:MAG: type II toxin-antitoxin system VapC family toxin [Synechococcus sp. SB0662_bin_45]|nr:type II toxin-antitoxin system VapC family toxin [Cyanobacteria bacterium MAG IRC1_bin_28]MDE0647575.1 type II toxin-antitoxin system VapC family toxin [Cyanobacteria bacterium MAG IRC4_bin_6]MXW12919.1 type II toxin-antitoxin system VapC family toxin [Synechococcus sp. SB0668_bin_13]MYE21355.1 type II toxin-antitoxin system VapC family toxin [Synechococcus sp. SB0662_bin_45]